VEASAWVVAAAAWLGSAFAVAMCWLWVDEDVNHWNWPAGKDGPSGAKQAAIIVGSMAIAAIPGGLVALLASRWF
jgi:hypothetical protein